MAERDGLAVDLTDTKEALRDALAKLDFTTQSLAQIKADLERRLKEKEDELERLRFFGGFIGVFKGFLGVFWGFYLSV